MRYKTAYFIGKSLGDIHLQLIEWIARHPSAAMFFALNTRLPPVELLIIYTEKE